MESKCFTIYSIITNEVHVKNQTNSPMFSTTKLLALMIFKSAFSRAAKVWLGKMLEEAKSLRVLEWKWLREVTRVLVNTPRGVF